MRNKIVLIGGGVRSGKSSLALELAQGLGEKKAFIATATRSDAEMDARIDRHRLDRHGQYETIEEPLDLAGALLQVNANVVVVDCVTRGVSQLCPRRAHVHETPGSSNRRGCRARRLRLRGLDVEGAAMTEPERIVSMLASGTELLCALGLGDKLVGRSHECDYPPWVRSLPEVSRPTFPIDGSSREIDELVRTRLHAGEPLYTVDEALLLQLAPDLLVTQTHCEVCAVSPADLVHHQPAKLTRQPVVALSGGTVAAILEGFLEVAQAVGRPERGAQLVEQLRARVDSVRQRVDGLPRPRVVCLEWIDPPFAMGNWGPELVEIAGGESLLGTPGEHSTTTPWQAVLDADPDVLIITPCGFSLPRAEQEMHLIASQPGYSELAAARTGRVFVADGNLYFNRSSPSLFETPEILGEMLHPSTFEPRHEGTAWRRYHEG